jgi:hypothetical protein
VVTTSS